MQCNLLPSQMRLLNEYWVHLMRRMNISILTNTHVRLCNVSENEFTSVRIRYRSCNLEVVKHIILKKTDIIIWKQQTVSIQKFHHYRSLPLPFWPAQHMQGRTILHQPQHLHINLPLPQLINLPQPLPINLHLPLLINQLPLLHTTQVSVDSTCNF